MDAKVIESQGSLDLEIHNLIMTSKTPISDALKYPPFAVLIFKPSNNTALKPFKDVKINLNSTPN